jgi:hypothetical protein
VAAHVRRLTWEQANERNRRLPHPAHPHHRAGLRTLGALLAIAGGVLTAIGLVSFFGAFSQGGGAPQYFWCAFLGLPLLAIGVGMLKMGYLGAVARYVATETTPVAADGVHDLAHGTRDAVRGTAGAIAAGLADARRAGSSCRACGEPSTAGARFCSQCGAEQGATAACSACGQTHAAGARYCAACGAPVAPAR